MVRPSARKPGRSLGVVAGFIGLLVVGSLVARSYYLAPAAIRVRHDLHRWLRPSGLVGQAAGILALAIFVFLWLYPLRKKFRSLAWTGSMAKWLDVHVSFALALPFIAAVHAGWRFDGLIGLGFWSMLVVWLSGIVGRYLYVRIPRGATGLELTANEIAAEREELLDEVTRNSGLPRSEVDSLLRLGSVPYQGLGVVATVRRMVADEVARSRAAHRLRRACEANRTGHRLDRAALRRVVRLASREMALAQQLRLLAATHRVFRLWHIAHRPFAMAALVAVLVHVGVAVAMGMTWFW